MNRELTSLSLHVLELTQNLKTWLSPFLSSSPPSFPSSSFKFFPRLFIQSHSPQSDISDWVLEQAHVLTTLISPHLQQLTPESFAFNSNETTSTLITPVEEHPDTLAKSVLTMYLLFLALLFTPNVSSKTVQFFLDRHSMVLQSWIVVEAHRLPDFYPTLASLLKTLTSFMNSSSSSSSSSSSFRWTLQLLETLWSSPRFFKDVSFALPFFHFWRSISERSKKKYVNPSVFTSYSWTPPTSLSEMKDLSFMVKAALMYLTVIHFHPPSFSFPFFTSPSASIPYLSSLLQFLCTPSTMFASTYIRDSTIEASVMYSLAFLLHTPQAKLLETINVSEFMLHFLIHHPLGFHLESNELADPIFKLLGPLFHAFCFSLAPLYTQPIKETSVDHPLQLLLLSLSNYLTTYTLSQWSHVVKPRVDRLIYFIVLFFSNVLQFISSSSSSSSFLFKSQLSTPSSIPSWLWKPMLESSQKIHGLHPFFSAYQNVILELQHLCLPPYEPYLQFLLQFQVHFPQYYPGHRFIYEFSLGWIPYLPMSFLEDLIICPPPFVVHFLSLNQSNKGKISASFSLDSKEHKLSFPSISVPTTTTTTTTTTTLDEPNLMAYHHFCLSVFQLRSPEISEALKCYYIALWLPYLHVHQGVLVLASLDWSSSSVQNLEFLEWLLDYVQTSFPVGNSFKNESFFKSIFLYLGVLWIRVPWTWSQSLVYPILNQWYQKLRLEFKEENKEDIEKQFLQIFQHLGVPWDRWEQVARQWNQMVLQKKSKL